jgi:hypothetical protein
LVTGKAFLAIVVDKIWLAGSYPFDLELYSLRKEKFKNSPDFP